MDDWTLRTRHLGLVTTAIDHHRGVRRGAHRRTSRHTMWWLGALLVVSLAACSSDENSGPASAESTLDVTSDAPAAASTVEMPPFVAALAESERAEPTMWVAGPEGNGTTFVAPGFVATSDDPQEAAWEYLDTFADVYGLAAPRDRFEIVAVTPTAIGTVIRFEQSLGGLPVYGGGFTVSVGEPTNPGPANHTGRAITAVTGMVLADFELAATVLDADAVLARAADLDADLTPDPATLRAVAYSPWLDGRSGDPVPAWEVEIVGDNEVDDQLVVLSALDGAVLAVEPLVAHWANWDVYESTGQEFIASDATHVLEIRGDKTEEIPPVSADSTTANENMRTVWEYFNDVHGRDGYDGAGGRCTLYIHDGQISGTAYFIPRDDGCRMVYGTVGSDDRTSASLDVVAHELTHGVVSTTAGLVYRFQPGALDEHYADFFATMIDDGDWDIGIGNIVLRDVSNPTDMSQFIEFQGPATSANDMGGVHSNSAIPNHAGFLVADSIGRESAEQIWYLTLLTLSPHTEFGPWACATISTARQMRYAGQLTEEEQFAVEDAMIAVGLVPDTSIGDIRRPVEVCNIAPPISEPTEATSTTTTEPTDSIPTTTTEPERDDAALAECFVGVWELDSQDFLDQIMALAEGELPPGAAIVHASGRYLVTTFADGTTEDRREEWTWSFSAPEGTIHVILDGVETGTWEIEHGADPTHGSLYAHTTGGSINVRIESAFGPLPGGNQTFPSETLGANATYRCSPTTLEVTTVQEGHTVVARFTRVDDTATGS